MRTVSARTPRPRARAAWTPSVEPTLQNLWLLRLLLQTHVLKRLTGGRAWIEEGLRRSLQLDQDADLTGNVLQLELDALETSPPPREGTMYENLALLGNRLGLNQVEQDVLGVAMLLELDDECWPECFKAFGSMSARRLHRILGLVLGVDIPAVQSALASTGLLTTAQLLVHNSHAQSQGIPLSISPTVLTLAYREHTTFESLAKLWFSPAAPSTLSLDDFAHIEPQVLLLQRLLAGAVTAREKGVNVLLYGAPGTGKTELARALAQALDFDLFEIPVDPDADIAHTRAGAYSASQELLRGSERTLLLFDEVEDAFPADDARRFNPRACASPGKAWLVRKLEHNPVPAIWISNAIDHIDPALLRRFDHKLELHQPPARTRRRIVDAHTRELGVSDAWAASVASDSRLQPANIQRAARVARIASLATLPGGSGEPIDVEHVMDRALEGHYAAIGAPSRLRLVGDSACDYDLTYVNPSCNLGSVIAGLGRHRAGSMCLYGPPGTGKTAFVQHLASQLDMPLVARRASELLDCFVGGTERALARMFQEARMSRALLFLDEADTFLHNRADATRSWEVSQVNELLVQVEAHDGIFICATNRLEALDPASLRRFALKVRFDCLTKDQRQRLFTATMKEHGADQGSDPPPRLDRLEGLTVGDFAAVARRARMVGEPPTSAALVEQLAEELSTRAGGKGGIGFSA